MSHEMPEFETYGDVPLAEARDLVQAGVLGQLARTAEAVEEIRRNCPNDELRFKRYELPDTIIRSFATPWIVMPREKLVCHRRDRLQVVAQSVVRITLFYRSGNARVHGVRGSSLPSPAPLPDFAEIGNCHPINDATPPPLLVPPQRMYDRTIGLRDVVLLPWGARQNTGHLPGRRDVDDTDAWKDWATFLAQPQNELTTEMIAFHARQLVYFTRVLDHVISAVRDPRLNAMFPGDDGANL